MINLYRRVKNHWIWGSYEFLVASAAIVVILLSAFICKIFEHNNRTHNVELKKQIFKLINDYIFLQKSQSAIIKKDKNGKYKLLLVNVSPSVVYIKPNESKKSGQMTINKFISLWKLSNKRMLKNSHNNAILNLSSKNNNLTIPIEILSNSYEYKGETLTYTIRIASGYQSIIKESNVFKNTSLLIDNISQNTVAF